MAIRYDDIGNRLKAFRIGSGLSAEEIARRAGISRTALYRFEKGEVVKIETLEKLAELLDVSLPTLLGVGIEYIPSALTYFERMRQIELTAEHIIVLAGPISFLLASENFHRALEAVLRESIPADVEGRERSLDDITQIMDILRARKETYARRKPAIVNLIAAAELQRFAVAGMVGAPTLSPDIRRERRAMARAELAHFASLVEQDPIGIQIGIVPETLPHTGFQIFRQPDRQTLTVSPFRLGEQPNVRVGVAMITSAADALALHHKAVNEMWRRAMKGNAALEFLRDLLDRAEETTQPTRARRAPSVRRDTRLEPRLLKGRPS